MGVPSSRAVHAAPRGSAAGTRYQYALPRFRYRISGAELAKAPSPSCLLATAHTVRVSKSGHDRVSASYLEVAVARGGQGKWMRREKEGRSWAA